MGSSVRLSAIRAISAVVAEARGVRFRQRQKGFVPHVIDRMVCGEPLRLWIADTDGRDWYERSSYLAGGWPEMEFLRDRMVRPGDVVLDCGAHQGVTAALLSRWVGDTGRVVAIDPVAHNLAVARQNLDLNGASNVELVLAAVSDCPGQTRIAGGTNIQIGLGLRGPRVEVVTIDHFQHLLPSLIKMDIEGAEGRALAGAEAVFRNRPRILLELHTDALPKFGTTSTAILDGLWSRDYETLVLWDDHAVPESLPAGTPIDRRVHIFAFPR